MTFGTANGRKTRQPVPHPLRHDRMGIRKKGELRRFYQKRRRRGLHHLSAVTATAPKLTRIVWRICTDQRDYRPEGRPAIPPTRF